MDRVEALRKFVEQRKDDPFPLYGLAMELGKQRRHEEAQQAFDQLRQRFPAYVPAYLHAGANLTALGRKQDAAARYREGIDAASKAQDAKTRDELTQALMQLEAQP
jgi:tetratricopeptide (TPR) repeat protein